MTCSDCGTDMFPAHGPEREGARRHHGRGLCARCYHRHRCAGTLADYTRRWKPSADVLEDWQWLHESGQLSSQDTMYRRVREAAPRLGMNVATLAKALERAGVRSPYRCNGERKAVA